MIIRYIPEQMKIVRTLLLGILILLSLSTGLVKLFQMQEEMELFQAVGWPMGLIIAFGVVQMIGGLLLILPVTRKYGAWIMIATFSIATIVLFLNGMVAFGLFSLLFIGLAGIPLIPFKHEHPSTS